MWPKGNAESPSDDNTESDAPLSWKEKLQELRQDVRARIKNGVAKTNERLEQLETKLDPTRQVIRQRYEEASESYTKLKEASAYAVDAYGRRNEATICVVAGISGLGLAVYCARQRRWTQASTSAVLAGGFLYASVYGLDFK